MKAKTVIQTSNVVIQEKNDAEEYAQSQGFDSLQSAIRFLIHKMAKKELQFGVIDSSVTPKTEEAIINSLDDIKNSRTKKYSGQISDLI